MSSVKAGRPVTSLTPSTFLRLWPTMVCLEVIALSAQSEKRNSKIETRRLLCGFRFSSFEFRLSAFDLRSLFPLGAYVVTPRRRQDRFHRLQVAGASAEVTRQRFAHLRFRGIGVLG